MGWYEFTIEVGTLGNYENVRARLERRRGVSISPEGDRMLKKISFEETNRELRVAIISMSKLGGEIWYDDLLGSARKLGLIECPEEVGPQLLLQMAKVTSWDGKPWSGACTVVARPIDVDLRTCRQYCLFGVSQRRFDWPPTRSLYVERASCIRRAEDLMLFQVSD